MPKNKYKLRKFVCLGCGKEVEERRPSINTKYCSLECYRKSKRPQRATGKIVSCKFCGKKVYKRKVYLKSENLFCSTDCANKFAGRNKIKFICKICGNVFKLSKSLADGRKHDIKYCSIKCRNEDKEQMLMNSIKGNLAQQNKYGLNKLELEGRRILEDIGIDYEEQVLMFNKFLVDILIQEKNLIIQWDGIYWHTKPRRVLLDKSQDSYLKKCGYKVLRITDEEIKNDRGGVYDNIKRAIQ